MRAMRNPLRQVEGDSRTFYYDADCGLCAAAVRWLRWADWRNRITWTAAQDAAILPKGLTQNDLERSAYLVCATGDNHVCATGDNHVCATGDNHVRATGDNHVCATGDNHARATGDNHARATGDNHARATGDNHARATGDNHVRATGDNHEGFFAFRRLLTSMPVLLPLGVLMWLPGAHLIGVPVYRLIADNRHKFSRCRIRAGSALRRPP